MDDQLENELREVMAEGHQKLMTEMIRAQGMLLAATTIRPETDPMIFFLSKIQHLGMGQVVATTASMVRSVKSWIVMFTGLTDAEVPQHIRTVDVGEPSAKMILVSEIFLNLLGTEEQAKAGYDMLWQELVGQDDASEVEMTTEKAEVVFGLGQFAGTMLNAMFDQAEPRLSRLLEETGE